MIETVNEDLIPDEADLFDGTVTRDMFIEYGNAFVWNALVGRCWLKRAGRVLDMGSGNGQKARALAEYLSPEGEYCGFDVAGDAVSWCRDRYRNLSNFRFDHSDVHSDWYNPQSKIKAVDYRFPYPDNYFDVAFAASLFTHLQPDASENYLSETARVLKPGGRLFSTWFIMTAENQGRHSQDVQGTTFSKISDELWHLDVEAPSRGVGYDEQSLRAMVRRSGLVASELCFGRWSQPTDVMGALQDTILAVKPGASA